MPSGIRALKLRVLDLPDATRLRLKHLSRQCKRLHNSVWRHWLVWHTAAGNDSAIVRYMQKLREWRSLPAEQQGEKPTCPIQCLPNELEQFIRKQSRDVLDDLNEQPFSITIRRTFKRMGCLKSDESNFPRWMRILADEDRSPFSSALQPIHFNTRNCTIIPPLTERDGYYLKIRLDRYLEPGAKIASSTEDLLRLKTSGGQGEILARIIKREYLYNSAFLVYQVQDGGWYAHIHYKVPAAAKPKLDEGRVAILRPAQRRPWHLRIDGFNHWVGGRSGRHVQHVRRQLLSTRWGKSESYTHTSTARKGHGSKRARGRLYLLKSRWQDFVRSANSQTVKLVIQKCLDHGCGTVVYCQPTTELSRSRFLWVAGKDAGRNDPSGWDWFQVKKMLAEACEQHGIRLIVRKSGSPRIGRSDGHVTVETW